mgnify:CR=1 FL=1
MAFNEEMKFTGKYKGARARLWKEQNGRCFYCEKQMVKQNGHPSSQTIDHYIPKSALPRFLVSSDYVFRGTTQKNPNLVLACYSCNASKGNTIIGDMPARVGPWAYIKERGWMWVGHEAEHEEKEEG